MLDNSKIKYLQNINYHSYIKKYASLQQIICNMITDYQYAYIWINVFFIYFLRFAQRGVGRRGDSRLLGGFLMGLLLKFLSPLLFAETKRQTITQNCLLSYLTTASDNIYLVRYESMLNFPFYHPTLSNMNIPQT